jgi:hypothetical protein
MIPKVCLQGLFFHLVSFAISFLILASDDMMDAALEEVPDLVF